MSRAARRFRVGLLVSTLASWRYVAHSCSSGRVAYVTRALFGSFRAPPPSPRIPEMIAGPGSASYQQSALQARMWTPDRGRMHLPANGAAAGIALITSTGSTSFGCRWWLYECP